MSSKIVHFPSAPGRRRYLASGKAEELRLETLRLQAEAVALVKQTLAQPTQEKK